MTGPREGRGPDIELLGATSADQDFVADARQAVRELICEVRRLRGAMTGRAVGQEVSGQVAGAGLGYVVLRCVDLERTKLFYEAIGLGMLAEQHGHGPRHYACSVDTVVLEFYPSSESSTSGLRIGLRVPDVAAVVERLKAIGAEVLRVDLTSIPALAVLRDPDGHVIEIVEIRP